MALLSIEPFLARPEKEARYEPAEAAACRKVVSMLLEGIAAHALDLDREARDGFRERIAEIHESMDAEASAETFSRTPPQPCRPSEITPGKRPAWYVTRAPKCRIWLLCSHARQPR